MKKIILSVLISGLVLGSNAAYAERMHIPAGTTRSYESSNGRFKVVATAQTEGGALWSMKLMEGDQELSANSFFDAPGALAVSDLGNVIASTDQTSHAEFGSESVSFYDGAWKFLKRIPYGDPSKIDEIALKTVKVISLSREGDHCAIGDDHNAGAGVGLYDVKNGTTLWDKTFGLPEMRDIVFAPEGGRFLVATTERENFDMLVQLVDLAGKVLWEKRFPKNFSSYEVKYVRFKDGKTAEVFDSAKNTYVTEALPSA